MGILGVIVSHLIPKEETEEPVIFTPVVMGKRPLHSKPHAKRFESNGRKSKGWIPGGPWTGFILHNLLCQRNPATHPERFPREMIPCLTDAP